MILQVLHYCWRIQDHLTLNAAVQKELRQLATKSNMWKIELFAVKRNVEEIDGNYASVKQGKQGNSFLQWNRW